jgi:hypothetical protein
LPYPWKLVKKSPVVEILCLSKKSEHSLSPSLMSLSTKDPDEGAEEQNKW